MSKQALDRFGQILMSAVRDETINHWDMILDGRMQGRTAEAVRQEIQNVSPDAADFLGRMVPHIVDTVLHHLLCTLEQEEAVELSVRVEGEKLSSIRDLSDGLAGELYSDRGWIARFSEERSESY